MKARAAGAGRHPELRPFRTVDAAQVQALIYRTIDACYTGVYPASVLAFFREYHSEENILQDARSGRTFLLELDGRVVGVGALIGSTIKRVFVAPEFQHRGLGRLLIAQLEGQARESGVATVDLHASLPSVKMYESIGYRAGPRAFEADVPGKKVCYYPMTKKLGSGRSRPAKKAGCRTVRARPGANRPG